MYECMLHEVVPKSTILVLPRGRWPLSDSSCMGRVGCQLGEADLANLIEGMEAS